jgi:hypothetical protein
MSSPASDLILRSTRNFEPPYDDEAGGVALTRGSLALALPLGGGEPVPTLRLLPGGQTKKKRTTKGSSAPAITEPAEEDPDGDSLDDLVMPAPVRTPRSELPPPRAFGARLVQHLTEATSGERPLVQLAPYLSHTVYQRLERHFATTLRTGATTDSRANVRSVRVCEPVDGVAELAAVVRRGGRMAAIALRLEGVNGRWQCTALQMT